MQRELSQSNRAGELSASQLRRSIYLFRRGLKARVEPDGSSSWVTSAEVRMLLFGRAATEVFKIQSGVKIAVRPQEIAIKATPASVTHSHRGQDRIQAVHEVSLVAGDCEGMVRTVRLTNKGESAKVRVLTLHDPTSLNYRRERDPPGEIGVNAFNRHDQVVMDDVGDTTGVRVVGFTPRPSVIYMTKDKSRALELLALGELPESSLGMSGSVILLTQHDFELAPGATAEVRSLSVFHPSSLESALNAASVPPADEAEGGLELASSNPSLDFAFDWAKATLFAIEGEPNQAERLWSGVGLSLARGDYLAKVMDSVKKGLRKDGTLRYSEHLDRPERVGPVETALYLIAACSFLCLRSKDKKLLKKWYPHIKKVADGLSRLAAEGLVRSPADSPDGWRRRLGAGFPTGYSSEVNLIVLRALRDASMVAYLAGKGSDSAGLKETSARLLSAFGRLMDSESGSIALNADGRGVVHKEETVDQGVGLSFFSPDQNLASSIVHRMLEKDFETGYGPRTVPTSNNLYYSPSYGDGQLGGYWTRAALSHALLAFSAGYPGIGSAQLEKICRLVHLDAGRLGGVPGEIPYWFDPERRQMVGSGSDPVAASRLIEGLVFGEVGLSLGSQGPKFRLPEASQLRWLVLDGLELSRKGALFVGRSPGRAFLVTSFEQENLEAPRSGQSAFRFPEHERLTAEGGLDGFAFWDSASTTVCLGNSSTSPYSGNVTVPLKAKAFSTALFAQMEELQQDTGLWAPLERVKLLRSTELKIEMKAGSWRMLRLSKAS